MSDTEGENRKQAVAIKYEQHQGQAPRVVAKGRGIVAEISLAAAQKNAVPVYQSKTLTGMLMAVELDKEIPPALYKAVAEVLAYIFRLDQNRRSQR